MTTEAKRRLTDISFEHEGAHVALVSIHQGGPANGVTTLITKATNNIDPEEVAKALEGSESNLEINMESTVDTIEKSVHEVLLAKAVEDAVKLEKAAGDAAVSELQKALLAQEEVLKAVQAEVAVFKEAAEVAKVEARKSALVAAKVPADKVEATLKSLVALDDEAFAATVETMKSLASAVDASDLMQESGVQGQGAESQEEVDRTTAILKARYGVK
jgi:transcriptional regulator